MPLRNLTDNEILGVKVRWIIDCGVTTNHKCVPLSIALGMKMHCKNKVVKKRSLKTWVTDPRKNEDLNKIADRILEQSGITDIESNRGCSYTDIVKMAESRMLKNVYNIVVYTNKLDSKDKFIPRMRNSPKAKDINLFLMNDGLHCILILNVKKFFACNHYCEQCKSSYNEPQYLHRCREDCPSCRSRRCCIREDGQCNVTCDDCNRFFKNFQCLTNHKKIMLINKEKVKRSVCEYLRVCGKCRSFIDYRKRDSTHICSESFCNICKTLVEDRFTHECYIPLYKKNPPENFILYFYDIESMQIDENQDGIYHHLPNLLITDKVCNHCINENAVEFVCLFCEKRRYIFEGVSCVEEFLNMIFRHDIKKHNRAQPKISVIAHNFSGYDGQFVMKKLLDRKKTEINVVMNGMKILKISSQRGKFVFIDSLCFLPMSLAAFSKAFGIQEVQKGYYPHMFNRQENYEYVGPIPDRELFLIEKNKSEFNKWYDSLKNDKSYVFNNRLELIKYCGDDVRLLREGCVKFMIEFVELTEINPFLQAFTIAGAVFNVFTKKFMPENSLGVLSQHREHSQSFICKQWLLNEDKKLPTPRIEREFRLKENLLVDGFDRETNTVYEFWGCWFHGCHKCYKTRKIIHLGKDTKNKILMNNRYDQYRGKVKKIHDAGYKLIDKWECMFRLEMKQNPSLDVELKNAPEMLLGTLDPRSALYGGRTEVFKTYYKTAPGERIMYYDFCSLYPYCNATGKYPIKHPIKKIKGVTECQPYITTLNQLDGFIQCKVLAPDHLFVPVLPYRCNKRLIFPLCRICAENLNTSYCKHSDDDRALIGCWAICELNQALKMNYKIIEIYELWIFNVSQYDPLTNTPGIFSEYMKTFLKIKQESTGWPDHCVDNASKQKYLTEFLEKEGIQLDENRIEKNPCRRSLAKLCANSLWGKLVQRPIHQGVEIFDKFAPFNEFVNNTGIEILSVIACNERAMVSWKFHNTDDTTFIGQSNRESVSTGVYTTAQARLKLYKELNQIDDDCLLYSDTDCVIFVARPDASYIPKTGTCIGDLTDEISDQYGSTAYVDEYVATAPKTYALRIKFTDDPDKCVEIAKCKGFTVSGDNTLNFKKIKSLLFDCDAELKTEKQLNITRCRDFRIVSKPLKKNYTFTLNKRVCTDEHTFKRQTENITHLDTRPFGYKK